MNELLLFAEIIVFFSLLLLAKKFFGKTGLYVWIALATAFAEIQVVKNIDIFGLHGTLGNVLFASNFLATDIIAEEYGKKVAIKGIFIGFFFTIVFFIFSQFSLFFIPSKIDVAHEPMTILFSITPRVTLSSLTMYLIANLVDISIYEKIKSKTGEKMLWLRNNVATILCNCLENFFFVFLAFLGLFEFKDIIIIAVSTSLLEIIIAICDTPFLYLARKIKSKETI